MSKFKVGDIVESKEDMPEFKNGKVVAVDTAISGEYLEIQFTHKRVYGSTSKFKLAAISIDDDLEEFNLYGVDLSNKEPTYPFEVYTRPYDGEIIHATSGIPAKDYVLINLPEKIRESL